MSRPARTESSVRPRCQHPQCNRFIRKTETHCAEHRSHGGDQGRDPITNRERPWPPAALDPYPHPPPDEYETGTYRVLLDNELRATLAKATSEILEKGLIDELGALRVVLLRVLIEETELAKLVTNITRIVTVAAQAMRVQHAVSGEQATTVTESVGALLASILPDMKAESSEPPTEEKR